MILRVIQQAAVLRVKQIWNWLLDILGLLPRDPHVHYASNHPRAWTNLSDDAALYSRRA